MHVGGSCLACDPRLGLPRRGPERDGGDRRDDEERVHDGAEKHEGERIHDGAEHLPLDVLEGRQGEEDEQRDDDDERRGLRDVFHCVDDALAPEAPIRFGGAVSHRVLDHQHAPFDDDSEVDRAERHDVAAVAEGAEPDEPDQHRERNGARHEQASAQAPQRQEQAPDDDERPLREVLRDGGEHAIDELGAIVVGLDRDAVR